MYRTLLSILFAVLIVLPGIGSVGGDNAGGTGVWILPRATALSPSMVSFGAACGDVPPLLGQPRETRVLAGYEDSLSIVGSGELGVPVATLIDNVSGSPIALSVTGTAVLLPASVIQQLASSGVTSASITIMDATHRGYVVKLHLDPAAQTGSLVVY